MTYLQNDSVYRWTLKSSLDRFIVDPYNAREFVERSLKSSLDRFIAFSQTEAYSILFTLKSSLDRFIGKVVCNRHEE